MSGNEEVRRHQHQQKLMQMALEVLRTPVKDIEKSGTCQNVSALKIAQIAPDMKLKTLVSVGVNTEIISKKLVDPLTPVEQLEPIKPVLPQISNKIIYDVLISSHMDNIPKIIHYDSLKESKIQSYKTESEDETIVYLLKTRSLPKLKHIGTQTNISLIQQRIASICRCTSGYSNSCSLDNGRCCHNSLKKDKYDISKCGMYKSFNSLLIFTESVVLRLHQLIDGKEIQF